jgi:hypothetical protein
MTSRKRHQGLQRDREWLTWEMIKKSSYMRLFYEIIDAMNCQIANRFSEIDQLGFLSLLDC